MNVHDLAHQLARSLTSTHEFLEFKKATEDLNKDPQAKNMLEDLRKKQFELQALKISGKPVDEAEKKVENLYNIVSYNVVVRQYMEAESKFATLMSDIYEIISKAVDLEFDKDE